ncbi:MAG: proton-conducting transporter membrane subunit [Thermodesulfobium sp.]
MVLRSDLLLAICLILLSNAKNKIIRFILVLIAFSSLGYDLINLGIFSPFDLRAFFIITVFIVSAMISIILSVKDFEKSVSPLYVIAFIFQLFALLNHDALLYSIVLELLSLITFGFLFMKIKSFNSYKIYFIVNIIYYLLFILNSTSFISFTGLLAIIAISLRLAATPFHWWQPKFVSITNPIISSAVVCVGEVIDFYLLFFILQEVKSISFITYQDLNNILFFVAILSIVVGAIMAYLEKDLKRLLSYSTIDDTGYFLLALAIGNSLGLIAAIIILINHSVSKFGLFVITDKIESIFCTTNISELSGIAKKYPFLSITFLIFSLSLIGAPFLPGFSGKLLLYQAAFDKSLLLSIFLIIASCLTLIYYIRAYHKIFWGSEESMAKNKISFEEKFVTNISLTILCIAILYFGIYPNYLINVINSLIKVVN